MPKKHHRDNPLIHGRRSVQSAATVLGRLMPRAAPGISSANQLLETVRAGLPATLRMHVRQAIEKGDELVILADSAAWAARLRLAFAEQTLPPPRRITVKVAPPGASAA
jgi:hypothetical protein